MYSVVRVLTGGTSGVYLCEEAAGEALPARPVAVKWLNYSLAEARRFDDAVNACRDAIDIQHELGNWHGEGVAPNNLAAALNEAKRYDEAIVPAPEAAVIFQEAGDRYREGIAAAHFGAALTGTGQHSEGVTAYEKAAAIFREVGDQRGESGVLTWARSCSMQAGR